MSFMRSVKRTAQERLIEEKKREIEQRLQAEKSSINSTTVLYVGNLGITYYKSELEKQLKSHFERLGDVVKCNVVKNKDYGFVHMKRRCDAEMAIVKLHGSGLNGKSITVREPLPGDPSPNIIKSAVLQVDNLPGNADITAEDLKMLFEENGEVTECSVCQDSGFVHMENREDAVAAIKQLHGTEIFGKRISVKEYNPDAPSSAKSNFAIYVGNVPSQSNDPVIAQELKGIFGQYGKVIKCNMVDAKQFAIIYMEKETEAKWAIKCLNVTLFNGRKITVKPYEDVKDRTIGTVKIYVGNILSQNHERTKSRLKFIFERYGTVKNIEVKKDMNFGFVYMECDEGATKAVAELNETRLEGDNIMNVQIAERIPKEPEIVAPPHVQTSSTDRRQGELVDLTEESVIDLTSERQQNQMQKVTAKININGVLPNACRRLLSVKETLDMISRMSRANISCLGKYMRHKDKQKNLTQEQKDKCLSLLIVGQEARVRNAIARVKEVLHKNSTLTLTETPESTRDMILMTTSGCTLSKLLQAKSSTSKEKSEMKNTETGLTPPGINQRSVSGNNQNQPKASAAGVAHDPYFSSVDVSKPYVAPHNRNQRSASSHNRNQLNAGADGPYLSSGDRTETHSSSRDFTEQPSLVSQHDKKPYRRRGKERPRDILFRNEREQKQQQKIIDKKELKAAIQPLMQTKPRSPGHGAGANQFRDRNLSNERKKMQQNVIVKDSSLSLPAVQETDVCINDVPEEGREMLINEFTHSVIENLCGAKLTVKGRFVSSKEMKVCKMAGIRVNPLSLTIGGPSTESIRVAVERVQTIIDNVTGKGNVQPHTMPQVPQQQQPTPSTFTPPNSQLSYPVSQANVPTMVPPPVPSLVPRPVQPLIPPPAPPMKHVNIQAPYSQGQQPQRQNQSFQAPYLQGRSNMPFTGPPVVIDNKLDSTSQDGLLGAQITSNQQNTTGYGITTDNKELKAAIQPLMQNIPRKKPESVKQLMVKDKVYLGLEEAPSEFNLLARFSRNVLDEVQAETDGILALHGKGSGAVNPSSKEEKNSPLYILILHATNEGLRKTKAAVQKLIANVWKQFQEFKEGNKTSTDHHEHVDSSKILSQSVSTDGFVSKTGHCVHMKNLPHDIEVMHILSFFQPLVPVSIYIEFNDDGDAKGIAHADFETHEEAQVAMAANNSKIGQNRIHLIMESKKGPGEEKEPIPCSRCDKLGHAVKDCPSSQNENFDKKAINKKGKCTKCGKEGHTAKVCLEADDKMVLCTSCKKPGHKTEDCSMWASKKGIKQIEKIQGQESGVQSMDKEKIIVVSNYPADLDGEVAMAQLRDIFQSYGDVLSITKPSDNQNFYQVYMKNEVGAIIACDKLNGFPFFGKRLVLEHKSQAEKNILVSNYPPNLDQEVVMRQLKHKFQAYGNVFNVIEPRDNENYYQVHMQNVDKVNLACEKLNGHLFMGKKIMVERKITDPEQNKQNRRRKKDTPEAPLERKVQKTSAKIDYQNASMATAKGDNGFNMDGSRRNMDTQGSYQAVSNRFKSQDFQQKTIKMDPVVKNPFQPKQDPYKLDHDIAEASNAQAGRDGPKFVAENNPYYKELSTIRNTLQGTSVHGENESHCNVDMESDHTVERYSDFTDRSTEGRDRDLDFNRDVDLRNRKDKGNHNRDIDVRRGERNNRDTDFRINLNKRDMDIQSPRDTDIRVIDYQMPEDRRERGYNREELIPDSRHSHIVPDERYDHTRYDYEDHVADIPERRGITGRPQQQMVDPQYDQMMDRYPHERMDMDRHYEQEMDIHSRREIPPQEMYNMPHHSHEMDVRDYMQGPRDMDMQQGREMDRPVLSHGGNMGMPPQLPPGMMNMPPQQETMNRNRAYLDLLASTQASLRSEFQSLIGELEHTFESAEDGY